VPGRLLFDTDVLVDYMRGLPAAVELITGCEPPVLISAITVAESQALPDAL
jgi:predicted nucleic acid-binding protein